MPIRYHVDPLELVERRFHVHDWIFPFVLTLSLSCKKNRQRMKSPYSGNFFCFSLAKRTPHQSRRPVVILVLRVAHLHQLDQVIGALFAGLFVFAVVFQFVQWIFYP
jgi:hypothetical protein